LAILIGALHSCLFRSFWASRSLLYFGHVPDIHFSRPC